MLTLLKSIRSDLCSISFTSMTLKIFTSLGVRGNVSYPLSCLHHPTPLCLSLMSTPPTTVVFAKHTSDILMAQLRTLCLDFSAHFTFSVSLLGCFMVSPCSEADLAPLLHSICSSCSLRMTSSNPNLS